MKITHMNHGPTADKGKEVGKAPQIKSDTEDTGRNTHRLYGKVNKGLVGKVVSVIDNAVIVQVLNSEIFDLNDRIRLECTDYTRIFKGRTNINLYDIIIGSRIKAKYLYNDIEQQSFTIHNILSLELISI